MWKWKLAKLGRQVALQRTIKDERHSQIKDLPKLALSQIKDETRSYSSNHANTRVSTFQDEGPSRASTFLFWFNEVPGSFTPPPNSLSPWVAPRGLSLLQNHRSLGAVIDGWKDGYEDHYRCREGYSLQWGLADLVHYGALLAVGFNFVHQWKPAVVGFNAIEQRLRLEDPSRLCPVKAIKDIKTVHAQPLQSEALEKNFNDVFEVLVEVPESEEKNEVKNNFEELSLSQVDNIDEIEQVLKDIENDINLEVLSIQGVALIKTGSTQEGIDMLRNVVREGNASAFFHLGNAYENGIGVSQDLFMAAKFYGIASSLGNAEASYNLAVFHLQGIGGMEENEEKAVELLTASAEKGLKEARLALGMPEVEKEDIPKDNNFLNTENGCEDFLGLDSYLDPLFNLAASMESGITSVPKDKLHSLELYRMAADKGHVEARKAFFRLYNQLFEGLYEDGSAGGDKKSEITLKHVNSSPSLFQESEGNVYSLKDRKTASCLDFGKLERKESLESQEDSGVGDQRVVCVN